MPMLSSKTLKQRPEAGSSCLDRPIPLAKKDAFDDNLIILMNKLPTELSTQLSYTKII